MAEDDVSEVVDEFTDELNPPRIESEADRLGISVDELLQRIVTEVKARIA